MLATFLVFKHGRTESREKKFSTLKPLKFYHRNSTYLLSTGDDIDWIKPFR